MYEGNNGSRSSGHLFRPTSKTLRTILLCISATALFISILPSLVVDSWWSRGDAAPLLPFKEFLATGDARKLSTTMKKEQILENEKALTVDNKKSTMLLGIFSCTKLQKYAERRDTVRKAYLSIDDPRLCTLDEYKRQVDENPNQVVCQIPYTFIIGAGDGDRPTDHGDDQPLTVETALDGTVEEDCTYLNIRENMEDGKSPTYFKFGADLSKDYNIDYVAKIDDDTVLSPELLFSELLDSELPPAPYNRRIYGGQTWYSTSKKLCYAAGQFYFMSSDLANYVGNVLSAEDRLSLMHKRHTEDADMGAFVFSHPRPVKFVNAGMNRIWIHPCKTPEKFMNAWENQVPNLPRKAPHMLPIYYFCTHGCSV
jgi:hypothetical protein